MAKSGGCRETTARLFLGLILLAGGAPVAPALGQRLELRAGGVVSGALVSDAIAPAASKVTAGARPAPLLGAALLLPLRPALSLEAGAAYAFSSLRARDASGSWGDESLGVLQALVGVRYRAPRSRGQDTLAGPYLRGGVGVVHYSAQRSIFRAGSPIEPAVEAGAGWTRAAGPWLMGAELAVQLHSFAPQTLRQEDGSAGGVKRAFLLFTLSRRVRP